MPVCSCISAFMVDTESLSCKLIFNVCPFNFHSAFSVIIGTAMLTCMGPCKKRQYLKKFVKLHFTGSFFTLFLARNCCSGINESSVLNFLACGSSSIGLAGCFNPSFKKEKKQDKMNLKIYDNIYIKQTIFYNQSLTAGPIGGCIGGGVGMNGDIAGAVIDHTDQFNLFMERLFYKNQEKMILL